MVAYHRTIICFTWILLWNIFDTTAFSIMATTPSPKGSLPSSAPLTLDPIFITTVYSSNIPVTAKRRFILRLTSKSVENEQKIEDIARGTKFSFKTLKWWERGTSSSKVEVKTFFPNGFVSLFRLPSMVAGTKMTPRTKSIDNLHCHYDHKTKSNERPSRIRLLFNNGRRVRHRVKPSLSWRYFERKLI
jgi:hypothetical protein